MALTHKIGAIALVLPLTMAAEGLYRWAYKDPVGIQTVCYGHTGPDIIPGKVYTVEECKALLIKDLNKAGDAVNSCAYGPMTDYQFEAFRDFTFNVGPGKAGRKDGFCMLKSGKPSTMVRLINEGKAAEACEQFKYWKQEGQGMPGLAKRRDAEAALCRGDIKNAG